MLSGGWITARSGWADARPLALGSTGTISGHAIAELRDAGAARFRGEDGIEECGGFGARRAVAALPVAELDDPPGPVSAKGQVGGGERPGSDRRPSALQVNSAKRCADLRKLTSLTSRTTLGGRCKNHACTEPSSARSPGKIATLPWAAAAVVGVIRSCPARPGRAPE